MLKKFGFAVLIVTLVAACANTRVVTDYESDYDFNALKSFFVLPVDKKIYDNPKVSELDVKRLAELIPAELSKRYTQTADKESADFQVRYFLVVEEKMRVESYNATFGYYRYGYGYRYGMRTPDLKNSYYEQGSIIVDVLDGKTEDVVWRGVTEGRVNKSDLPSQKKQRMAAQITQLFSIFPPQPALTK